MCQHSIPFSGWIIFHLYGRPMFCWSIHLLILILENLRMPGWAWPVFGSWDHVPIWCLLPISAQDIHFTSQRSSALTCPWWPGVSYCGLSSKNTGSSHGLPTPDLFLRDAQDMPASTLWLMTWQGWALLPGIIHGFSQRHPQGDSQFSGKLGPDDDAETCPLIISWGPSRNREHTALPGHSEPHATQVSDYLLFTSIYTSVVVDKVIFDWEKRKVKSACKSGLRRISISPRNTHFYYLPIWCET